MLCEKKFSVRRHFGRMEFIGLYLILSIQKIQSTKAKEKDTAFHKGLL